MGEQGKQREEAVELDPMEIWGLRWHRVLVYNGQRHRRERRERSRGSKGHRSQEIGYPVRGPWRDRGSFRRGRGKNTGEPRPTHPGGEDKTF